MNKHTIHTLALATLTILATNITAKAQSPMQILDNTAEKLTHTPLKGSFTIATFTGTTAKDTTTGTLQTKGNKFTLHTPQLTTWYNGQSMWTLLAGSDEVSHTTPTIAELQQSSPTAFINIYKTGYHLTKKTTTLRGQATWEITMSAKKKQQQPTTIIVNINKDTHLPMCIRAKEQGNWTRISIHQLTPAKLTDQDFTFPKSTYPTHQIIEM